MEETFLVMWTLTSKREDNTELESLVVFAITHLNDFEVLTGQRKLCGKG